MGCASQRLRTELPGRANPSLHPTCTSLLGDIRQVHVFISKMGIILQDKTLEVLSTEPGKVVSQ